MEEENVQSANEQPEAPILGKFKDVDALKKAYEALEAEFTRRNSRLKELERNKAEGPAAPRETPPSAETDAESENDALYRKVMESGEVRERVLSDYLDSLAGVPLMTKGRGIIAPPVKPKTFAEAGSLALGYLKSKK